MAADMDTHEETGEERLSAAFTRRLAESREQLVRLMEAREHNLEMLLEHMDAVLAAEQVLAHHRHVDPGLQQARLHVQVVLEDLQTRLTRVLTAGR